MTTLSITRQSHCKRDTTSIATERKGLRVLRGNIESVALGQLSGWVVDSEAGDEGVSIGVYEGNRLVASGLAMLKRGDLAEAGYTAGAFGFELDISPTVLDGSEHKLLLRLSGETEVIATSIIAVPPYAVSRIDTIEAGVLTGHVELDTASEHSGFNIEILCDGVPVTEGVCAQAGRATMYPFSIALPAEIFDDNLHVFSVQLKGYQTKQEPFQDRLPSISTPWQYLNDSCNGTRLSALSKVAAYRYAALQAHLEDVVLAEPEAGLVTQISNLKRAHDILVEGHENRTKFPELRLPYYNSPKISIVIPVHNKFSLTYHCLASLILAKNATSFEVIVVDDLSSDGTRSIDKCVQNIRVTHNTANLGFLLSSKRGAELAKGEFIVFLNNDTEVTSGWLDALIDTFNSYDSVGMVGSKLIYPNGKLQEAGGIVWGSGRPWNIGNGKNAEHPMYNYVRQADYLSGASLMIRSDVWKETKGFSEELAPAYYEDTDLAFKVHAAGYKIMYCPFSTVIHFEGMSNGRDTNAGVKRFQSINAPKFRAKWRHAYRHNGSEGQRLSLNLDRGVDFRALVVDYTTPRPDHDAGGYAAVQEILLLQELGCKVTFVPNNMAHMGSYTEKLQKQGVECIFAPFYTSVGDFLKERGGDYDLVYITRYDIAEQVIASVRQFSKAKIIFNNADLHFLRELRAALASGEKSLLEPIRTRDRELQVMREVDAVLSYNEVEHSVIASHNLIEENVFKCPWVLEDRRSKVPFEERSGIAFLGGFNHLPNREAVKYFVQSVMPFLRIESPGIMFHVYGSKVTADIEELASDDVIIEGYVESLNIVFDTCRVFVAPLLSGAGIKGKVLESIAHGIPCVLSSVAAEATGLIDRHSVLIADEPQQWSRCIAELYTNKILWKNLADRSHELVDTLYSRSEGLSKMQDVLQYVELEPAENRSPLFRLSEST